MPLPHKKAASFCQLNFLQRPTEFISALTGILIAFAAISLPAVRV